MRYYKITLQITSIIFLCCIIVSCKRGGNTAIVTTSSCVETQATITNNVNTENLVEVVVVDSTGEILGIKANQVGDYYLINPGNEQMISMEGHSLQMVPEENLIKD